MVEVFHNMTAKPRVKCPQCGGRTRKRIGAGAGIIFKGSGFYETDYKRKSRPKERRGEGEAAGEKASVAEVKSDNSGKSDGKKADKSEKD